MIVEAMNGSTAFNADFLDLDLEFSCDPKMIKDIVESIPRILELAGPEKRREIYSVVSIILAFSGMLNDMPQQKQLKIVDVVTDMIMSDPSKLFHIEFFIKKACQHQQVEV